MKKVYFQIKEGEKEEKRRAEDTVGLEKQDSNSQPIKLLNENCYISQRVSLSSGMDGVEWL